MAILFSHTKTHNTKDADGFKTNENSGIKTNMSRVSNTEVKLTSRTRVLLSLSASQGKNARSQGRRVVPHESFPSQAPWRGDRAFYWWEKTILTLENH